MNSGAAEFNDTISAISTPLGEGGLAVVRLSGPQALAIADACFVPLGPSPRMPSVASSHTLHYGRVRTPAGETVDEVMLAVLRAPRTFTREDVIEISCHGGVLVAKMVLDTVLRSGARLAQPGEFTRRAFLNGRIDLAQAEAVADLISSQTELAVHAAHEQLAGKLSGKVNQLRDGLLETLAHVEAQLDFPEEDLEPDTRESLIQRLEQAAAGMIQLLRSAREGQVLRRGIRVVIVGRPNAGKSSLLNQLLGRDRAIVSSVPGTTRDTIEETANIRGLPMVFIDTAGLREARDELEAEGIRRSRRSLEAAELILHVVDASEPLNPEDEAFTREIAGRKQIVIRNKSDLPRRLQPDPPGARHAVEVSCLNGHGMEALKDTIRELAWSGEIRAGMFEVMLNSRHEEALRRGHEAVFRSLEALRSELTLELAAIDLRTAVDSVGEIVGKTVTEDLLDVVFKRFCIGK